MGPTLSSLVELQAVEQKLRTTLNKLNKGKKAVLAQQNLLKKLQESLVARHEENKMIQMSYDRLNLDLRTREEEIGKLRVNLNLAKTNKEYSSVLTHINTSKADTSKIEDQMLNFMGQIEAGQQEYKEIETKIAQGQENLKKLNDKLAEGQEEIQVQVDVYHQQYEEKLKTIPAKYRDLFERLAERYDGEVLADVTRSNTRKNEQTCGGCYMSVPLEVLNSLMSNSNDAVPMCPSCGRILVMR